jgi:hypothetical protein
VNLIPVEVDIRQPESTPPILLASLGAAPGSGLIGNPTQDDDFAVVSNGTDNDLASELVINLPSGAATGTVTANLKMKGSDGSLKFEQNSVSITPGTPKVVKIWGATASSGENKSKVEIELVMPGGSKSTIEEDLTIIDGVKISFEGTFYSPVDSRPEGWRPWANRAPTPDPAAAITEDGGDISSKLSFCDGDQSVTYRSDSAKPKVTVKKVESLNPPFEMKKDALIGAEVWMVGGQFRHNNNLPTNPPPVSNATKEEIDFPAMEFRKPTSNDTYCTAKVTNNANTTQIQLVAATAGIPGLAATIQAKATAGNELAKWLTTTAGGAIPNFLEGSISKARAEWKNDKFLATKGTKLGDSIAAKAVLGAQEKRGVDKTKVQFKLHHFNGWTLNGEVSEGEFQTP